VPIKFTPGEATIKFEPDGELTVHGLTVPNIAVLVSVHKDKAESFYNRVSGLNKTNAIDSLSDVMAEAISTMPLVVSHIIAVAADAEDEIDLVQKLPLDVQVAALEKIGELTFAMQGGPKNFLETVRRMAAGANRLADEVKSPLPSQNGSGASEAS
jgi:hypothetical protein